MEKQNYDFFLFTKLAQANGLVKEELEYDYQFEDLESLYNEYDNSIYNTGMKGAYECIQDYILAKLEKKEKERREKKVKGFQEDILCNFIEYYTSDEDERLSMKASAFDYVDEGEDWTWIKELLK